MTVRRIITRLLRVPNVNGAGRTFGRLTISHGTNSPGCPVVDGATVHVTRDNGTVVRSQGVLICPRTTGPDRLAHGLVLAWRGLPDAWPALRRLRRLPLLGERLFAMRGHLA